MQKMFVIMLTPYINNQSNNSSNGGFGMSQKFVQTSFLVVKIVRYAFSLGLVSRQLGAFS